MRISEKRARRKGLVHATGRWSGTYMLVRWRRADQTWRTLSGHQVWPRRFYDLRESAIRASKEIVASNAKG